MLVLTFDNSFVLLPQSLYQRTAPDTVPKPALLRINQDLCKELAIDARWLTSDEGIAMLAGNTLPPSADAISMVYAGHQFGGFSPRLGDGRAILIGEVLDRNGIRKDLQLKGSGRTPFSRGGDGKATLSAILREYVLSEAMFALGIPTTRALAAVATGELVDRGTDIPGAILARVAHSHVRVGTFQYFSAQRDTESLLALANYVIDRHFPQSREANNPIAALLGLIVEAQAHLVARWMQVGFIHGVMNTDNMQVAGETIDYGPCAFMDDFHPQRVFSSVDKNGRYAWNQQPVMAKWNLTRLAEALLPLLSDDVETALGLANSAVEGFDAQYNNAYLSGFKRKLGLINFDDSDGDFIDATTRVLAASEVDFTLFFRHLTQVAEGKTADALLALFAKPRKGRTWLATWQKRIANDPTTMPIRAAIMQGVNPIFIARNHRVEQAIAHGVRGDFEAFHRLASVLSNPYGEQAENSEYEKPPRESEKVRETFCNT